MQKTKKTAVSLSVVFLLIFAVFYISNHIYSFAGNKIIDVNIKSKTFQVEVVSSDQKTKKGLGGRKGICENCGMLFKFSKAARHSFWMKEMRFPLDIIWIKGSKIVHVEKNVQPYFSGVMTPDVDADAVLEVNAGAADEHEIGVGDELDF